MESIELVSLIQKNMIKQRKWLVVAESCTGGLISSLITEIPGASEYFLGGVVSYANEIKHKVLGVSQHTLMTLGAVSQQAAQEMAAGVRRLCATSKIPIEDIIGLSVTGISGPGGGTINKPVGMVWCSIDSTAGSIARQVQWQGTRKENNMQTAQFAFEMLLEHISPASPTTA